MEFIALISGGKDSIYTINLLKNQGHSLKAIVYIYCTNISIDSYMYQTVGKELINAYSECLGVPIYIKESNCKSINISNEYVPTEFDEVEDLLKLLKSIDISYQAISSGAIFSIYQKNRVENVCKRLNKVSLSPLFMKDQFSLLNEIVNAGIHAIIVKVAGIPSKFIGVELKNVIDFFKTNKEFNACGEGGEYETMVLDAPFFKKRIVLLETEILTHPEEIGKVERTFYLRILKYKLEIK